MCERVRITRPSTQCRSTLFQPLCDIWHMWIKKRGERMIFVCMCACVCSLLNRLPWCPQHSTSLGHRTDLDCSISRSNGPSEGWKPQNVIGQSRGGVWLVVRCKGLYSGSRLLYGYYASSYVIRDYWTIHGCHCMCVRVRLCLLSVWRHGGQGAEGTRRR